MSFNDAYTKSPLTLAVVENNLTNLQQKAQTT